MKQGWCAAVLLALLLHGNSQAQLPFEQLVFEKMPVSWDEGIPLGNGMLGTLIWQKGDQLRFSLDRADLWDQRPMKGIHRPEFSYKWVQQQVAKKDYQVVQDYFDKPYDNEPAPTKIPGAAFEIPISAFGLANKVALDLYTAVCTVHWQSGLVMKSFISGTKDFGVARFENFTGDFKLLLKPPVYNGPAVSGGNIVGGDDLSRLGYEQGAVTQLPNAVTYLQKGWKNFAYRVTICWKKLPGNTIELAWRITSANKPGIALPVDNHYLFSQLNKGFSALVAEHAGHWHQFWKKSEIVIPDARLLKQYYLEQYKFCAVSAKGAPPISLQAVWTADNGRIPPWKGDFHHDLNTQLSYWPAYTSNHLEQASIYLDHLDANKEVYRRYTSRYFGVNGLNVPGVTTLDGTEMGGWIQYSFSPTIAAWLSQHFYLQWKYSMDKKFLVNRAYPWLKETAIFLQNITVTDSNGNRKLPISSSPEINDNSLAAWFTTNTNYDLALMKFVFKAATEMATALGNKKDAEKWQQLYNSFSDFALSKNDELMFAESLPYRESHRHFSHLMAIQPLGLITWEESEKERRIIRNSLRLLDSVGPANWCGYSYSWQANLKARAKDGEGAAKALNIFAKAFCSPNSFHLNGDQTNEGFSSFKYRPFTLEGNFAFAAGLQEMLIQSYAGFIEIMPAVPALWQNISFKQLRTEGAFLVDATKQEGNIKLIKITATCDGLLTLKMPDGDFKNTVKGEVSNINITGGFLTASMKKGSVITIISNVKQA